MNGELLICFLSDKRDKIRQLTSSVLQKVRAERSLGLEQQPVERTGGRSVPAMWGRKGGEWPGPFQMEEWLRTLLTPRVTCSKPFKVPHPGRTLSSTNLGAWEVPFCIGGRKPWREGKGTALIPYMTIEVGEEILKLRVCLPAAALGRLLAQSEYDVSTSCV